MSKQIIIDIDEYNELVNFKKEIESGKKLVIRETADFSSRESLLNFPIAEKRTTFYTDEELAKRLTKKVKKLTKKISSLVEENKEQRNVGIKEIDLMHSKLSADSELAETKKDLEEAKRKLHLREFVTDMWKGRYEVCNHELSQREDEIKEAKKMSYLEFRRWRKKKINNFEY